MGVLVMRINIIFYGFDQDGHVLEYTTANALFGYLAEPTFYHVQP